MTMPSRQIVRFVTIISLFIFVGSMARPAAADEAACCDPCLTKDRLLHLSYCELEALYRTLPAADLTGGYYEGTVLWGKKDCAREIKAEVTSFVWKGKWIYPEQATMLNQVGHKQIVPATIYSGTSYIDGGASLIFDYSCSTKFARKARDEVRQICPGLYLGIMHVKNHHGCPELKNYFLLEATCTSVKPACDSCTPAAETIVSP
ncbi:hypothetical protein K2Y11_07760 [bacterium]|nr:hypothetical protein [bacterium]